MSDDWMPEGRHLHPDWRDHVLPHIRISDTKEKPSANLSMHEILGYNGKLEAIRRLKSGENARSIGADLGVHPSLMAKLKKELKDAGKG